MVFGMTPYTFFHVPLSLIGIFTGFIALFGMIAGKRLDGWNGIFLLTTTFTSITGFFFPFHGLTPGYIVGAFRWSRSPSPFLLATSRTSQELGASLTP